MMEKRRYGGRDNGRRNDRPERDGRNDRFKTPEAAPEETEGQLEGRNALTEALKAGRTID